MYSREMFNDGKGTVVWIAWTDHPVESETGPTRAIAEERLRDRQIDWRFIALSALMNRPFEGITAHERAVVDEAITRIRNLDDRLERRRS